MAHRMKFASALLMLASAIFLTAPLMAADNNPNKYNTGKKGVARAEEIRIDNGYNSSQVVTGHFRVLTGADKEAKALAFIAGRKATFGINRPDEELNLVSEKADNLGKTHLKFQQVYQGIPVWGARTIVHFEDDQTIYLVGGQLIPTPQISTKPAVSEAAASTQALGVIKKLLTANDDLQAKAELVVYPFQKTARLVQLVTVTSPTDGGLRWRVFVDAQTGEVIDKFNDIEFDGPDTGQGPDVHDVNQTFPIYLLSGDYIMYDATRVAPIYTYENYYGGGPISTDPDGDKIWDDNPGEKADVSGHVNAGLTIDYFWNTFGRSSFDGAGSDLIVNVHDSAYVNNAYWNGAALNFADGDGVNYLPFSGSLDVVAHEFSHGVTDYTAGLIYRFQSGALNESFSDVFGSCVDRDDWLLGEEIRLSPPGFIRSMEDPTLTGQPDHMDNYLWYPIETDNGGVHINSGIPNHAFYFAASLTSRDVAEQVWYRALTTYLTPSSGMYFWSAMIMQSTADLYGEGSTEYDNILLALSQVGFNSTYTVPEEMTMSNIVGTVSYDTVWIHNPTSNTVTVTVNVPPSLAGLNINAPASVAPDDSGAVELIYDTQGLDSCDVGLYGDRLEITTDGAPYSSNIYIPIDILVGYTTTSLENVAVTTSCLTLDGRNTSGVSDFIENGNDVAYDGSLLVGVKDGNTRTVYRDVFGTLSLIPVDTVTTGGDSTVFRISSADGRIQGHVNYRWYGGPNPDTCNFIIADYTLENICDTDLTVYPGLITDFDINNSGNNVADYDAANNLVYVKDYSSGRAAGFAMLNQSAFNLRSIYNPDLIWGNNFTDNVAYNELAAAANVNGLSPSDYSALMSFGGTLLKNGESRTFSVVWLYSTTGLSGLQASLDLATVWSMSPTPSI